MPETTVNPIEAGRKLVDEIGADRVEWRKGGDAAKLYVGKTVAALALPQKRKAAIRLHVYDAALPKSLVKGLDAKPAGRGDAKKATNITIESAEQAKKVRPILEHASKGRAKKAERAQA